MPIYHHSTVNEFGTICVHSWLTWAPLSVFLSSARGRCGTQYPTMNLWVATQTKALLLSRISSSRHRRMTRYVVDSIVRFVANSGHPGSGHFCVTAGQVWCWGPRHRIAHVLHSQGKFVIHRGYLLWLAEIHPDFKQSKVLWGSVWCHRGLYWFFFNIGVTTTVAQILRRDCAQRYQREIYDCSYVESKLARPEVFPAIVQFHGWSV